MILVKDMHLIFFFIWSPSCNTTFITLITALMQIKLCVYLHSFNENNIIQEESVKEQSCFAASLIVLSATRQPTTDYPLCFLLTLINTCLVYSD